jgi:hypothetical protein
MSENEMADFGVRAVERERSVRDETPDGTDADETREPRTIAALEEPHDSEKR